MSIRMTQDKLDAIAVGDLSGRSIHPLFIRLAELLGSVFYHDGRDHPGRSAETRDVEHITQLVRIQQGRELSPLACIQAFNTISFYYYYTRNFSTAWRTLVDTKTLIVQNNFHITLSDSDGGTRMRRSVGGHVTPLTAVDSADELRCTLLHAWYRDKTADMMLRYHFTTAEYFDDEVRVWAVRDLDSHHVS